MVQLGNPISSLWNLNNHANAPSSGVSTACQGVRQREEEGTLHQLGAQGVRALPVLGKGKNASEPHIMQLGNHISSLWNLNNRAKAPSSRVSTACQAVLQRKVDGVLHQLRPQGVRALPVLYR